MYKCLECGNIFDEGEQVEWDERHGLDSPPYEHFSGCPICGGIYERTERCKFCGGEFLEGELTNGICNDCIESCRYDFIKCIDAGESCKENITINSFLASMFSESEIEGILTGQLIEANEISHIDCLPYINADKEWFAEWMVNHEK